MPASALLLGARIASLNLCTDEYLLLLARPQEVASVSFLAQDPLESSLWRTARRHHSNRGSIEGVLGRRPDVLLTMGGGGKATRLLAGRLRLRTVELVSPASFADVAVNLQLVAAALGEPDTARPWLARLRRLQQTRPAMAKDAMWLSEGGQTIGPGSIGAQWLRLAGLEQRGDGRPTLETLLVRPPTVMVKSRYRSAQVSNGRRWLTHPLVRRAKAQRISTDGRPWTCMGPLMIAEIERLRAAAR
ncbi:MAG: ABC transporter substrate-binding protein [Sphingomonas sp.]|nr:ABC transporter substrate-binding protein [Sphingomonas sp.]